MIPSQALFGQLLIGLINGSFYALLSLGLSVIFGLLNIINFAHGAQYMMGAFVAYFLLTVGGPRLLVGAPPGPPGGRGPRHRARADHAASASTRSTTCTGSCSPSGVRSSSRACSATSTARRGMPYAMPAQLTGGQNLGFMFLPNYRAWVIVFSLTVCLATWYVIERTRLGASLRAATENPPSCKPSGSTSPA